MIFNWGGNSTYGGERGKYNIINNYYKPGPATVKTYNRILNPWAPFGQYYLSGNVLVGNQKVTANNWLGVQGQKDEALGIAKIDTPLKTLSIHVQTAEDAYQAVLQKAGANIYRDPVDLRTLNDVATGTAKEGSEHNGIIDSQKDVGGWPDLKSLPAPLDTDHDGIPDAWEKQHGLSPNDPTDGAAIQPDKQYTNLEVYLNSLVKE
ncbi:hypothetical protein RG47T_2419 [Mucilaginibacter polytrichastri]|uniref:Pectate lyase n=1 Tax=Mucilaginibacter polytrichastri TaxID=1302689 RepID=A0A1Q5ZYY4_9SPHI|nr:hypothetical protein RG47T_2419 [Mucilaginibacter polytrichastri]